MGVTAWAGSVQGPPGGCRGGLRGVEETPTGAATQQARVSCGRTRALGPLFRVDPWRASGGCRAWNPHGALGFLICK